LLSLLLLLKRGDRVRASVRRQEQAQRPKAHKSVESYVKQFEFVTVPDWMELSMAFSTESSLSSMLLASPVPVLLSSLISQMRAFEV
jgi:hypothetical protein